MTLSKKRTPSGKKVSNHGKRDDRPSGLSRGTPLTPGKKVAFFFNTEKGKVYSSGVVEKILTDHRGVPQKRLKAITRGCTIRCTTKEGQANLIKIRSRTNDHLVGEKI